MGQVAFILIMEVIGRVLSSELFFGSTIIKSTAEIDLYLYGVFDKLQPRKLVYNGI